MFADDDDQLYAGPDVAVVGVELDVGEHMQALQGANRFLHVFLRKFDARLQADGGPDQRLGDALEVAADLDFFDRRLGQTRHRQQGQECTKADRRATSGDTH